MYKTLCPYAIGVHPSNLNETLTAASVGGFEGVELPVQEIARLVETIGASATKSLFDEARVRPAAWGLTVEWRQSDDVWLTGLEDLPKLAKASHAIGCTRVATWVLSGSNDRDYDENYDFHIKRFTPIAKILADNGCSLGLEFIGPKTMLDSFKYPFIWKMREMLALGREIGPNVGVLLDCWHWYTSGGTIDDLSALKPEQVVYVHVNDAPVGLSIDEQIDQVRALPGETGVIDIAGFLRTLDRIGYDGPVTPEPFKAELNDLSSDSERLKTVGASMNKIFAQAGLTTSA
jgi:sugar phosphate isomerase/epimerase